MRFLHGYGILFEWVDGDNFLFEAWALLWQLARLLILCLLADGALQMALLCGMTTLYLVSVLVRKPRVRRIQNGLELLATGAQLYTITHLTLAARLPGALEEAAASVLQVSIREQLDTAPMQSAGYTYFCPTQACPCPAHPGCLLHANVRAAGEPGRHLRAQCNQHL